MKTAEFIGGCYEGRHIVGDERAEWRVVRRPDPVKLDDRAEVHIYRKGSRHFSRELSGEQRRQIIKERGELVYIFEKAEPLTNPQAAISPTHAL